MMRSEGLVVVFISFWDINQFAKDVIVNIISGGGAKTVDMCPFFESSELSFLFLEVLRRSLHVNYSRVRKA